MDVLNKIEKDCIENVSVKEKKVPIMGIRQFQCNQVLKLTNLWFVGIRHE